MQGRVLSDWPVLFAALTMAAIPMIVLFLLGQRQFIRGLAEASASSAVDSTGPRQHHGDVAGAAVRGQVRGQRRRPWPKRKSGSS